MANCEELVQRIKHIPHCDLKILFETFLDMCVWNIFCGYVII
jgi:hypothetical protein